MKTIALMLSVIASIIVVTVVQPDFASANNPGAAGGNTNASTKCTDTFIGIPAWYRGLQDANCGIKSPTETGDSNASSAQSFVTKIILNIIQAAMVIAGYVAVFFVMKGGFMYIYSAGSSDGMAAAKKTIMNALIGLLIAILAASIINAIAGAI